MWEEAVAVVGGRRADTGGLRDSVVDDSRDGSRRNRRRSWRWRRWEEEERHGTRMDQAQEKLTGGVVDATVGGSARTATDDSWR
jgi:hypothetical protein